MSLGTAARVAEWVEEKLDELEPSSLAITFFGGEPLLNQPVMLYLAERLWASSDATSIYVATSNLWQSASLQPWEPLDAAAAALRDEGRATVRRVFR